MFLSKRWYPLNVRSPEATAGAQSRKFKPVRPYVSLFSYLISVILLAGSSYAAEFYIRDYHESTWRNLRVLDRLFVLSEEGVEVYMAGPIKEGDVNELKEIHALVPVHSLHISSPGGSVAEAIRIAEFCNTHLIRVGTDYIWQCDGTVKRHLPSDGMCGCASACALIWLVAPARAGSLVKIHRPYFKKEDFANLSDTDALRAYSEAGTQVRLLLEKGGYSKEFITRLFNIPRERSETLSADDISALPVNAALDELISSRCYGDNEQAIATYFKLMNDQVLLRRRNKELSSMLPGDVIYMDLLRDKHWGPLASEQLDNYKRQDEVASMITKLWPVHQAFVSCKLRERRKVTLAKSGERIKSETRKKIAEFARLLRMNAYVAAQVPKLPETGKPLEIFGDEMRQLRQVLQRELSAEHWNFVMTGK